MAAVVDRCEWRTEKHQAIDAIAATWNSLVPRDLPHLRAGMLRAVEQGAVVQEPAYHLLYRNEQPVAAAVSYTLPLDTAAATPPFVRDLVDKIRRRSPGFMWKSMRICGSPISNAESGVYLRPDLLEELRRAAFTRLAREVIGESRLDQTIFFKDFHADQVAAYAGELERLGCFPVDPWAGTRLDVRWNRFEDYLAALAKRYRRRVRKDLQMAGELDFELLDSFADLAPRASALYQGVLAKAKFNFETATESFFTAVSQFDQARLLVARQKTDGEVVGVNLLLFGDTCMHNLFIGFDYELNEKHHLYFALVIHSLRLAIERGIKVCYMGQDSFEFKARLGAKPFPMTAYMKHRVWPVHAMLRLSRHVFFPPNRAADHDVFQEGAKEED